MQRTGWRVAVACAGLALAVVACEQGAASTGSSREEAIAAAQAGGGSHAAAAAADEAPADVAAECRVELAVSGMTCAAGCSPVVMSALESVDGVARVEVDFEAKHAAVSADGVVCTDAGAGQLVEALRAKKYDGAVEAITPLTGG